MVSFVVCCYGQSSLNLSRFTISLWPLKKQKWKSKKWYFVLMGVFISISNMKQYWCNYIYIVTQNEVHCTGHFEICCNFESVISQFSDTVVHVKVKLKCSTQNLIDAQSPLTKLFKAILVGSWRCGCLVNWFCYLSTDTKSTDQLITKPSKCTYMTPLICHSQGQCVKWTISIGYMLASRCYKP